MTDQPPFSDAVMDTSPDGPGHARTVCGARLRQAREDDRTTCARPAGWGTDHVGFGACRVHGGSTPSHEAAARGEQAKKLLGTLGVVEDPGSLPVPVVNAELQLEAAKQIHAVRWLELQVGEMRPEQVEVSPWPALLGDHRKQLNRLLVEMARLGLDEQRVKLDERRLDVMVLVLQRVLARLGLEDRAAEVHPLVHAELVAVGGEVGE